MKPSFASSYPVRACANEAGVDYSLALTWVDAADYTVGRATRDQIVAQHGHDAYQTLKRLIDRVHRLGAVRVRRWSPNGDGWALDLQDGAA